MAPEKEILPAIRAPTGPRENPPVANCITVNEMKDESEEQVARAPMATMTTKDAADSPLVCGRFTGHQSQPSLHPSVSGRQPCLL